MTPVTCRLTAKNRDQLRNRVWTTFLGSLYDPKAQENILHTVRPSPFLGLQHTKLRALLQLGINSNMRLKGNSSIY